MWGRSWPWLKTRIQGLFTRPPTISPVGVAVPSTRIDLVLNPPKPPNQKT